MFTFLVWPTLESVWQAAEICRTKKQMPDRVIETGKRSMADTLALVHQTFKKTEVVIFAPFVYNEEVCKHLQAIVKDGGQIHWYGEPDQQVEENLQLCCKNRLLHLFPKSFTVPLREEIKKYLRYKITLAFLGDEYGEINREELKKTIVGLANTPNTVPAEEKHQVDTFAKLSFPAIEGRSAEMKRLKRDIHRVAKAGLNNVLLLGETGTGKEATAFFLHSLDPCRCTKNFGIINCAGLQEEYLMSELFGHVKGAYTDAIDRKGLIAKLNGGTLFLDELPDMAPRAQAMLLRFLENGAYTPMGSDETKESDVKIIAGGQHELLCEKMTSKEFRKDLYYRLAGKVLTIPSLRDITDDLPVLIDHLAYKMGKDPLKRDETIHYFAERLNEMAGYYWPGNIRELVNYVRRRLTLGKDEDIVLGEYEIEEKIQKNILRPQQNQKSQEYYVDVIFRSLFSDVAIENLKSTVVKFEKPDDVRGRYINHVYKCLNDKGASNALIATKLGIAINTLKKNIKNL